MPKMLALFLLAALGFSCARPAVAAPEAQWLMREPPTFRRADRDLYHAVVSQVFSDSTGLVGGCFQMVSLVGGQPEEMVYVECVRGAGDSVALVHLVAAESIDRKLKESGLDAAIRVGVRRTENNVNAADADLLRRVWLKMLEWADVETGTRHREQVRDYYFAAPRVGLFRGWLGAVAKNPPTGSPAAQLVELAQLLAQVADPKNEDSKPTLMARARARAAGLLKVSKPKE